jgi:hypothetical protein
MPPLKRSERQRNRPDPGGHLHFLHSSDAAPSALPRASLNAATTESSRMPFSEGTSRLSSIATPITRPLAEALMRTRPPPATLFDFDPVETGLGVLHLLLNGFGSLLGCLDHFFHRLHARLLQVWRRTQHPARQ